MKGLFLILGALGLGVWALRSWETNDPKHGALAGPAEMNRGPVVACFSATWCGACQQVKPSVKALAAELAGRVTFVAVDVDAEPALASQYRIEAVPTFVVLRDGHELGRFFGAPKDIMRAQIMTKL